MDDFELAQSIEQLMSDLRLVELCELQRTGDEVLDVIRLTENQHSDILAWMLDAKEGHGQGDEILRDLLISASTLAAGGQSGLDGRGSTARFFEDWTPSKIRTTSFGAAFAARELGMSSSERVDLFVIDAQNKFILLIENKAGASHKQRQLDQYKNSFKEAVTINPRLREYAQVYIAIDRSFDGEDSASRPSSSSWLHLGYEWLKTSATRALMHVQRGNAAARLVVSYCNRQTDWKNPDDDKCLRLAADLNRSYPSAVKHLIEFSPGRTEKLWLTSKNGSDAYLLFLLQNKGAVAMLKETQGMASVKASLLAKVPSLPTDNVEFRRKWLNICPTGWELYQRDDLWPVFISVWQTDDSQSKFSLALCWNAHSAQSPSDAELLRSLLTAVEPKFGKHSQSRWRRVELEGELSLTELLKRVADLDARLLKVLPT